MSAASDFFKKARKLCPGNGGSVLYTLLKNIKIFLVIDTLNDLSIVSVSEGATAVDVSTMVCDVLICGLGASYDSGDVAVVRYLLLLNSCS